MLLPPIYRQFGFRRCRRCFATHADADFASGFRRRRRQRFHYVPLPAADAAISAIRLASAVDTLKRRLIFATPMMPCRCAAIFRFRHATPPAAASPLAAAIIFAMTAICFHDD